MRLFQVFGLGLALALLLLSAAWLRQVRLEDPLLGLWVPNVSDSEAMPQQVRITGQALKGLVKPEVVLFTARQDQIRSDLRTVVENYGLTEEHLERIVGINDLPNDHDVPQQPIRISLPEPE